MRKQFIRYITGLLLLLAFQANCGAHDLKMAFFEFSESTNGLSLEISFDKDDLAKALLKINPRLKGETNLQVWEAAVKNYLAAHLRLQLNNQSSSLIASHFRYDENYVRIEVKMNEAPDEIKEIKIWSDCLVEDIRGQSNIVKSKLHGKTRTFRLNKKRTSIKINY